MSQINVNNPGPAGYEPVDTVDTSGDRTAAAGINMITVLIVLAVLAVIAWYLFTGPLHAITSGTTNVNVNTPAQPTTSTNININPPSAPAPANNAGSSSTTTNSSNTTNTGGTTGGSRP
jgi:hypothetical protein